MKRECIEIGILITILCIGFIAFQRYWGQYIEVIEVLISIVTLYIGFIAFQRYWGPKLSINIEEIDREKQIYEQSGSQFQYHHVVVTNSKRYFMAMAAVNVIVYAKDIEIFSKKKELKHTIYDELPLHQAFEFHLKESKIFEKINTIGFGKHRWDLGRVDIKNEYFELLHHLNVPELKLCLKKDESMELTLSARAKNAISNDLNIKIEWDDNAEEMKSHLKITKIKRKKLVNVRLPRRPSTA